MSATMTKYHGAEHENCAICERPTQFSLDTNGAGRLQAYPDGTTIKCDSCGEFVCGSCIADSDKTICRSCAACSECMRDAGAHAIDVRRGSFIRRDVWAAGTTAERICPSCHQQRVMKYCASVLLKAADVDDQLTHKIAVHDVRRELDEYFGA